MAIDFNILVESVRWIMQSKESHDQQYVWNYYTSNEKIYGIQKLNNETGQWEFLYSDVEYVVFSFADATTIAISKSQYNVIRVVRLSRWLANGKLVIQEFGKVYSPQK